MEESACRQRHGVAKETEVEVGSSINLQVASILASHIEFA